MSPSNAAPPNAPADGTPSVIDEIGAQRRAPFGENPAVGARGTRTQHRIVRAALEVFGEVGYHACRVERITETAGCSRPSFYQYFSSKEDLFRQLAGEVAQALFGVVEAMDTVTPDEAGWHALRDWLGAHSALYEKYWPVFAAYADAKGSDAMVATGAARVGERQIRRLSAKIDPSAFRSGPKEVIAGILLNAVNRANRYERLLERVAPERAPDRERMLDSLADVLHRSLFARRSVAMTGYVPSTGPARRLEPDEVFGLPDEPRHLGQAGRRTRARILDAGAAVFAANGYHDTRVDDVVAAEVSHGTFYRYFENKDEIFREIAGRSARRVFEAITRYPDIGEDPGSATSTRQLRRWVTNYFRTWAEEGPIFRIWVEALGSDPELAAVTVRVMDGFRTTLAGFLAPRDFGDTEMDAFLLVALLDFTNDEPKATAGFEHSVRVVVTLIRRGFLGIDARF